jgi:hypothetical protein
MEPHNTLNKIIMSNQDIKTDKEIVIAAANLIDSTFLARGVLSSNQSIEGKPVTGFCILGAFRKVAPKQERKFIYKAFKDFLGIESIPLYNDNVNTTKEQVVSSLLVFAETL